MIRQYNNPTAYALERRPAGGPYRGLRAASAAWPQETPLSLADRLDAQNALARLGFYAGAVDAMIGAGTRAALRAWQKARGLPADGYLSIDMLARLRAETAPVAASPPS